MPGRIYVCIEVLLSGLASADTVARVIIGKDVAVDTCAKADVETTHLPEVNCITMGEEHRESGIRDTADVHAADSVSSTGSSEEDLRRVQLSLRILKLCSLCQVKLPSALHGPGP